LPATPISTVSQSVSVTSSLVAPSASLQSQWQQRIIALREQQESEKQSFEQEQNEFEHKIDEQTLALDVFEASLAQRENEEVQLELSDQPESSSSLSDQSANAPSVEKMQQLQELANHLAAVRAERERLRVERSGYQSLFSWVTEQAQFQLLSNPAPSTLFPNESNQ
jgi:glucan-binding YG repeat protein